MLSVTVGLYPYKHAHDNALAVLCQAAVVGSLGVVGPPPRRHVALLPRHPHLAEQPALAAARRLRVAVAVSSWAPSRSEATKAAVTEGVRLGEELP